MEGELEDFTFVEINGMRLTEPSQVFIYELLSVSQFMKSKIYILGLLCALARAVRRPEGDQCARAGPAGRPLLGGGGGGGEEEEEGEEGGGGRGGGGARR